MSLRAMKEVEEGKGIQTPPEGCLTFETSNNSPSAEKLSSLRLSSAKISFQALLEIGLEKVHSASNIHLTDETPI